MWKNVYIAKRWYVAMLSVVILFLASYVWAFLFYVGIFALFLIIGLSVLDLMTLFYKKQVLVLQRSLPEVFHLGDFNEVGITIHNTTNREYLLTIIEEIPEVFQVRDFEIRIAIGAKANAKTQYQLKGIKRGAFTFKSTIVMIQSPLRLFIRRMTFQHPKTIKVYPSTKLFKKVHLMAVSSMNAIAGQRKLKRIGSSVEFDQIRDYVFGDDSRNINWKATARKQSLMVNNYVAEKSQTIYNIIDGGRMMNYTIEGLTLMDYAINASLMLSKIVLEMNDKIGLIAFNERIQCMLRAERHTQQMMKINNLLYNHTTAFKESAFDNLVNHIQKKVSPHSLLVLYTNFESAPSFERQLPYLKQLSKTHVLLVVLFENKDYIALVQKDNLSLEQIYVSTLAEKYIFEKKQIIKKLHKLGMNAILTSPHMLTVDVINKYLDLKMSRIL